MRDSSIESLSKLDPALSIETAVSTLDNPLFLFFLDPLRNPSPVSVIETELSLEFTSTMILFIGDFIRLASSTQLEKTSSNSLYIPTDIGLVWALTDLPSSTIGTCSSDVLTLPTYIVGLAKMCSKSLRTCISLLGFVDINYLTIGTRISVTNSSISCMETLSKVSISE